MAEGGGVDFRFETFLVSFFKGFMQASLFGSQQTNDRTKADSYKLNNL